MKKNKEVSTIVNSQGINPLVKKNHERRDGVQSISKSAKAYRKRTQKAALESKQLAESLRGQVVPPTGVREYFKKLTMRQLAIAGFANELSLISITVCSRRTLNLLREPFEMPTNSSLKMGSKVSRPTLT